MLAFDAHDPALAIVLNLHLRQPLLLVNDLILHAVLLLHLEINVPLLLVVLLPNDFGLLSFFLL